MLTWFFWLRIRTSGKALWTAKRTLGSYKKWRISWRGFFRDCTSCSYL